MYQQQGETHNIQRQPQSEQYMDHFGSDVADPHDERLKAMRVRQGECINCGQKTHKVSSRFPMGKTKREPLTIEGEVFNGKCLRCAMPSTRQTARYTPEIPNELEVPARLGGGGDDDMTVASEITMDPCLGAPDRGIHRQASAGSRRSLMASATSSQFESVSEETPVTEFNKSGNDIRVGDQLTKRTSRILEEEDTETEDEDEEEVWENHKHLLRTMEDHQQGMPQQRQQFHPLAVQHNLTSSDHSLDTDGKDSQSLPSSSRQELAEHNSSQMSSTSGNDHSGSSPGNPRTIRQRFHPLARVVPSQNPMGSGHSVGSASEEASISLHSNDSDRISRLCQGSRSNILMEVDKSGTSRESEVMLKSPIMEELKKKSPMRAPGMERSHDSNRFSLVGLASPPLGDPRAEQAPHARRRSRKSDANRFSLTKLDNGLKLTNQRGRRCTVEGLPPNLEMEMHNSKNWDSMDILRDAAAEANGEGLPEVGAGRYHIRGNHKGPNVSKKTYRRKTSDDLLTSMMSDDSGGHLLDEEDEVNTMAKTLSRRLSESDEADISAAIDQRRTSVATGTSIRTPLRLAKIEDIPVIIRAVKSRPSDAKCTINAFQSLFLLATDPEPEGSLARKEILGNDVLGTLLSSIWEHIDNVQVLLALFRALWAIADFNGGDKISIGAFRKSGVFNGVIFAMQSHSKDIDIQESGCELISRLTETLPGDTPEYKSAVVTLSQNVKSIDPNSKAFSLCLDALNSLCQLSNENKREFVKAGNDCHNVIIRGLTSSDTSSLEARELVCQLFWCATSERSAVSALSMNSNLFKNIVDALKSVPCDESSVELNGAALGTLANLAQEPNNHSKMVDLEVVPILCEAIYAYGYSEDVNSTACTAIANLSSSNGVREEIAAQGGIPALLSAMKSSADNASIQGEALRALHNLSELSTETKIAIVADLGSILKTLFTHEEEKYIQQITCLLLCRLAGDEKSRASMISVPGTYDALKLTMKTNPTNKLVLKAACSTLRHLSSDASSIPILLKKGFISLVVDAMHSFEDCEELQECSCSFLMNTGSTSPEASVEICSVEGIHCIVKAMQTHPNSAALQQSSCGALYAITKGDAHKSMAISAGAVDAVIYIMVVHASEIKVLQNAVKVLSNISSLSKGTKVIADAAGISTVVEIMKSNPHSTPLILSGSRFIQNMSLSNREYAEEAVGGITPMLGCMDEHPGNSKLVEESCKALRVLVLKSENCKDRVINADGAAVIEKTMKENNKSQRWQTLLLDELFQ